MLYGTIYLMKEVIAAFDDFLRNPTEEELNETVDWVKQRDAHEMWPAHVEKAFDVLKKALRYA